MSDAAVAGRKIVIERVLHSRGTASGDARRAAYDNAGVTPPAAAKLVDTVARNAYKVTDDQVRAAASATSEDAVFELVVCAAVGQASRQLASALAALDDAERGAK
jgi:hypothetical protein